MKYRMKYRLKDRELQRKLDALSNGDFSRQLASNKKRIFAELNFLKQMTLWFRKSEGPFHALVITPDMVEKVREYDPHAWNKYPEVEPPKDVWMRCENVYGSEPERLERFAARYTSQYEDGEWVDAWFSNGLRRDVTSFRPWDEEDEE